jgi:hypothetical protein
VSFVFGLSGFGSRSPAHVAGLSPLMFGCAKFYEGKNAFFLFLGRVWQTCLNEFLTIFFVEMFFFFFAKQTPNDFQKF